VKDRYSKVEIGEISEYIRNGLSVKQSKEKNGLPITRIETIWNEVIDLDRVGYAGIKVDEKVDWLLKPGDILISHINSKTHLGKCALYEGFPNKLIHGMNLLCLRPNARKVVPNYLIRVLQSQQFKSKIPSITKNSVNQSSFNVTNFKRLTIPLPSLAEQKRIAAILDKADAIRHKRRQAIQLADEFMRSVFLDMFGDPVSNSKNWEKGHIQNLCEEIIDCPHATPRYAAGQTNFACIRSSDIQNGYMDWSSTKYVDELEYKERIRRLEPVANDVIYCREGARFGNAARIPKGKTVCLGQRMMLFRSNHMVSTAEFIWSLLNSNSVYQQAVRRIGGSASPHVNVKDIKKFIIFIPPLSIQQKYSVIVKKIDAMKEKFQKSSLRSEQLFNSISQRAFRGEI
jgi:type I restriction enzyme S subunit